MIVNHLKVPRTDLYSTTASGRPIVIKMATTSVPIRSNSVAYDANMSDDEAVPTTDPKDVRICFASILP